MTTSPALVSIQEVNGKHKWFKMKDGAEVWVVEDSTGKYKYEIHTVKDSKLQGDVIKVSSNNTLVQQLKKIAKERNGVEESKE